MFGTQRGSRANGGGIEKVTEVPESVITIRLCMTIIQAEPVSSDWGWIIPGYKICIPKLSRCLPDLKVWSILIFILIKYNMVA